MTTTATPGPFPPVRPASDFVADSFPPSSMTMSVRSVVAADVNAGAIVTRFRAAGGSLELWVFAESGQARCLQRNVGAAQLELCPLP